MNIVVIPARFGSTRFPGKPLARIAGHTMIWYVYHQSLRAKTIDEVWVATDDKRIHDEVASWGGKVMMTRADHPSGTDRVAEVASKIPCEIVVNVQGDEPMIDPAVIDAVVEPLVRHPSIGIVTPITHLETVEEFFDSTVAKVVRDAEGYALYFSRSPIPYSRDYKGFRGIPDEKHVINRILRKAPFYRHVGLYGYQRETLISFCGLPHSALEDTEKLEQLRALEYGIPVYTVVVEYRGIGVDTPDDVEKVATVMTKMGYGF